MLKKIIIGLILFFGFFGVGNAEEKCNYKIIGKYDEILDIVYSPNGKEYSLIVENKGIFKIIKNGKVYLGYNFPSNMHYSNDSKILYFIASKNNNKIFVKINYLGKEKIKYFEKNDKIYYSRGYESVSIIRKLQNGKQLVIKDGVKTKEYKNIYNFVYSPNGKSYFFSVNENKKVYLIKDGKEIGKQFKGVSPFSYSYSKDSKHFAYKAKKNGKYVIIKDGKVIGSNYDGVSEFSFLNNGNDFIYIGIKNSKKIINLNGKEILSPYDNIYNLKISKNKNSYSLAVENFGKNIIIKDGKVIGNSDSDLILSQKGMHYAYKNKDNSIVKDGKKYH